MSHKSTRGTDSPELQEHEMERKVASSLQKGDLLMLRNKACRITDAPVHFKNGKHGKAKVTGSAVDYFDPTKSNIRFEFSAKDTVWVPVATRHEFIVIGVGKDGGLGLMHSVTCDTRHDISLPDGEVGDTVRRLFDDGEQALLTVQSCLGRDLVVGCRKDTSDQ